MEMSEEHLSHMKEFERNQKWFIENFKRILREYREKFVAVWNQRVIDEDTDLERRSKKVKEKTTGAKGVYIAYVSEKPVEMILRFPSILGRDVISRFRLIFDRANSELLLTKEKEAMD